MYTHTYYTKYILYKQIFTEPAYYLVENISLILIFSVNQNDILK